MSIEHYDILIIGAGPGGYTSAIRAAQQGKKVALIEKGQLGGVCLNWGCIPSKNLINQAEKVDALKDIEAMGIDINRSQLDYQKVHAISRDVVTTLTRGIKHLLSKHSVKVIPGTAELTAKNQVTIDNDKTITAANVVIATGSTALQPKGFECDEVQVLSSTGILQLTQLPKSLIILGGGAIGCEFAYVMNSFGVKVTLIEALPQLLPSEDSETCQLLEKQFRQAGIRVLTKTRVLKLSKQNKQVSVTLSTEEPLCAEKALVVFGRKPNTDNLGLSTLGISVDKRGFIETDQHCQTSIPGIYAIGDVTSTPALAHVAIKEGDIAINHILGKHIAKGVDPLLVPSTIYCEPQVAGFGLKEADANNQGIPYKKSIFNYAGLGKSIAMGKPGGLIKVLCAKDSGEILGAHIIGHNATELIHELLLAKSAELLPEDITAMIHAHPTLSEGIMEAFAGIQGHAIHV